VQENYQYTNITYPFDAHYCHMCTAVKHPVPDRVKRVPGYQ